MAQSAVIGRVSSTEAYPIGEFRQLCGLSFRALGEARRRGLKIRIVGRRKYVLGSDWLSFLASQATSQEPAA